MTTDQRNVVDLLIDQHHQMNGLLLDVLEASGDEKVSLFQNVVRLMAVHESAEEEIVHPMARPIVGDPIVDARLREEKEAREKLIELYDLGEDHVGFDRRLRELANLMGQHDSKEETEEFTRLREQVDPVELQRMGSAVAAMEEKVPTASHPKLRESARAHGYYGPPLAVYNRAHEALAEWQAEQ